MKKSQKTIGCIYCIILLAIVGYVIIKTQIWSGLSFQSIQRYILPQMEEEEKYELAYEISPILGLGNQVYGDQLEDLSYDDFQEATNMPSAMPQDINTQSDAVQVAEKQENVTTEIIDSTTAETEDTVEVLAPTKKLPESNGITYSMESLNDFDFLVQNCYAIDSSTLVNREELNAQVLLAKDLSIDTSSEEYKVLIYHTHGSESFVDSRENAVEDTVIGVGDELARILQEDYGIMVYHDRTAYDMVNGTLDRSEAYNYASQGVDEILKQYPSIEVVIDLHRDGVKEDVRLVKDIDGRPTAQIMFLNGMSRSKQNGELEYLYNPYRQDNLAFSLQMHLTGKQLYGDLMRRIYVRGYRYNLDKLPRSALIEVGAQTNTVQEAKNAMIQLGAILYKVLVAD
ncbi:MAG: stage II sporulation protein P [Wujia sp.]